MKFTLRQLEAFEAVARRGHFGRAADDLQVSQPTLSAQVRSLERRLGVTLLRRSRAGTTVSDEGRVLLVMVRRVLAEAHAIGMEARCLAQRPPTVRLAASPSLANRLVPRMLQDASVEEGAPQIAVVEVATGEVLTAVRDTVADVGVGHWLVPTAGMECMLLGRDELRVITATGQIQPDRPVTLSELAHLKLLVWPREQAPEYYDALVDVCRARGLEPDIQLVDSRLSGARSYLLQGGNAFSIVPVDFSSETPLNVFAAPLDPPAHVPLHVVWRSPPSSGARWIASHLRRLHAAASDTSADLSSQ